jgi:MFS transporter, Spinster family, sphingosine-1-phosphate transporter
MQQTSNPSTTTGEPRAARYAVATLFVVNAVSYTDRSILTLVVGPVKKALNLSDGQIGLMQGPAFVLTFVTAGLMFGYLVDRSNRRNLLLCCIAFWSIAAAACGFAHNVVELFVARMGVGIGEAAMIPTAISLVADYFVPQRRGGAWGLITMGVYVGTGLSLVIVGLALPSLAHLSSWLALNESWSVEPWRMVMVSLLIPGAVCCVLLSLVKEPARSGHIEVSARSEEGYKWPEGWKVLLPHHLFSAFAAMSLYAINSWFPTVLIREHGLDARQAGLTTGTIVAVVGICSAALGGRLADVALRRGAVSGRAALAMVLTVFGLIGFVLISSHLGLASAFVALVLVVSPMSMAQVITVSMISDLAKSRNRGITSSIYFAFAGVIGTATGPAAVGYVSDAMGTRSGGLSSSIALVGGIAALLSLIFGAIFIAIWRGRVAMRTDLSAARPMRADPLA